MTGDKQLTIVQSFFQKRFHEDDRADQASFLDPKVSLHIPGTHQLAGVFETPEIVVDHLRDLFRLTHGKVNVIKWEDWMVGVDHIAGLVDIRLQRQGQIHTFRILYLVTMSENDKIRRIELFVNDQAAIDRFLSHR